MTGRKTWDRLRTNIVRSAFKVQGAETTVIRYRLTNSNARERYHPQQQWHQQILVVVLEQTGRRYVSTLRHSALHHHQHCGTKQ